MFKKIVLTAFAAFLLGAPVAAKAEATIGQSAPEFSVDDANVAVTMRARFAENSLTEYELWL